MSNSRNKGQEESDQPGEEKNLRYWKINSLASQDPCVLPQTPHLLILA